jgi:hypothetical protein
MALVVLGICCYTACQKRANRDRRDYYFTPLPQKLLFGSDYKDADPFQTPLTGKYMYFKYLNCKISVFKVTPDKTEFLKNKIHAENSKQAMPIGTTERRGHLR